jgi:hypothetical protein
LANWLPPIAIKITPSEGKGRIVVNIYDFNTRVSSFRDFDISPCFPPKDKIEFGISFKYENGIDKDTFRGLFMNVIGELYYTPILNALAIFNISPFRIMPPRVQAHENGFVIYSGVTNTPAPICKISQIYILDGLELTSNFATKKKFNLAKRARLECCSLNRISSRKRPARPRNAPPLASKTR